MLSRAVEISLSDLQASGLTLRIGNVTKHQCTKGKGIRQLYTIFANNNKLTWNDLRQWDTFWPPVSYIVLLLLFSLLSCFSITPILLSLRLAVREECKHKIPLPFPDLVCYLPRWLSATCFCNFRFQGEIIYLTLRLACYSARQGMPRPWISFASCCWKSATI